MIHQNESINMSYLLKLSNPGLVGFISHVHKKVLVIPTSSMLGLIERYSADLNSSMFCIQEMNTHKDTLEVIIIEEHKSIKYLNYMKKYHCDQYISQGYSLYDPEYTPVSYDFHIRFCNTDVRPLWLYIKGKSRSIDSMILIGKFKSMPQCEKFKSRGIEKCLKEVIL